jgi:dolichyl-phosphate-mannose--protein O-mannosyl transferase
VFYVFARRALASERQAVLATVCLLADGVYLVQSRVAMTNIFAVLFQVTSALFILKAVLEERLPVREMLLGGLFLGLALSTRWTSLWAWGFLGLVLLVVRRARAFTPRELLLTAVSFGVIPLGIYVLSYVPWMRQGHSITELWPHTKAIWRYHADLQATHPYFSKWYTWPWLYRPTWYYFNQATEDEIVRGIVAIGNPALWWVSVPVTIWALVTGARARDPRRLFSGFGYCCLYLPWGISPRTLNYSHYLFEAIPYACLSLGMLLDFNWDAPGARRTIARGYVAVVIAMFVFFLPFLLAIPIPMSWYYFDVHGWRPWTWFPTWV